MFWGISFAQQHEQFLKRQIKEAKTISKKDEYLIDLGTYYKHYQLQKADSIKNIIVKKRGSFDEKNRLKALFFLIEITEIQGNSNQHLKYVQELLPLLPSIKNQTDQFEIYKHLGKYYATNCEFATSKFYLTKAVDLAKKSENNIKLSQSFSLLAHAFMVSNKKDSSLYYSEKAIQFARKSANKNLLAESFNNQANIYAYFGQFDQSIAKNYFSLQLVAETNNVYKMASYSREIGQILLMILNLNEAEKYFKQSIEYSSQIFDQRQLALGYSNLANLFKKRKKYNQAIEFNKKAIAILNEIEDQNSLGEVYNNLGLIYSEKNQFELALINFKISLNFFVTTKNLEKIALSYQNLGVVFQKQKKYKKALVFLIKTLTIEEKIGLKSKNYQAHRIISEIYSSIGNSKAALKHLKLYIDYIDSNSIAQEYAKIAELSESYRSEQRERIIQIQADSIEHQKQEKLWTSTKLENTELKNKQKTQIILGFIFILLLAGILGFYVFNNKRIKHQQKEAEMFQTLLRTQMNPHFIFNSLSVIQSYIYENDVKNSSNFLVNFSRLIRLILENSSKEFIPISTEVEILQKYLETQKLRFEDRFDFFIELSDEMILENVMIPPMITQPFVENAIEHGQLHTIEGGFIKIFFSKNNDTIEIRIEDNGVGRKIAALNKKSKEHSSMAIKITQERIFNLNYKYKTAGFLQIEDYDKKLETGTKVLISLPYQSDNQIKKS